MTGVRFAGGEDLSDAQTDVLEPDSDDIGGAFKVRPNELVKS